MKRIGNKLHITILPNRLYEGLRQLKSKLRNRGTSVKYKTQMMPIFSSCIYETQSNIKAESWDEQVIAEVYGVCEERRNMYFHPRQDIKIIKNAIVSNGSDIVITQEGVVWDKFEMPTFSKQKLDDNNLERVEGRNVVVRRYLKQEFVKGCCISLLGTCAYAWAHFIEQYLPKLYYSIEAGLLDKPITILTPVHYLNNTIDHNITECIQLVIKKFPMVKVKQAEREVEYVCEQLYWMPSSAQCGNGAYYHSTFDTIIPERVKEALKKHLISELCVVDNQCEKSRKLFLSRSGMKRGLINNEEIENFFMEKGYEIVDCSKLSIKDKAQLFSSASEIAGPNGSAWSNCMFCGGGVKGIMFTNLSRADEIYQSTMASIGGVKILNVTGDDDQPYDAGANYYIPLKKIKDAFNYWYPNV